MPVAWVPLSDVVAATLAGAVGNPLLTSGVLAPRSPVLHPGVRRFASGRRRVARAPVGTSRLPKGWSGGSTGVCG